MCLRPSAPHAISTAPPSFLPPSFLTKNTMTSSLLSSHPLLPFSSSSPKLQWVIVEKANAWAYYLPAKICNNFLNLLRLKSLSHTQTLVCSGLIPFPNTMFPTLALSALVTQMYHAASCHRAFPHALPATLKAALPLLSPRIFRLILQISVYTPFPEGNVTPGTFL